MTGIIEQAAIGGLARLVDMAITAAVTHGIERPVVVARVRELEAKGQTPDQITDALADWAKQTEDKAQAEIDKARSTNAPT